MFERALVQPLREKIIFMALERKKVRNGVTPSGQVIALPRFGYLLFPASKHCFAPLFLFCGNGCDVCLGSLIRSSVRFSLNRRNREMVFGQV